jgi:hypothetical protein
MRALVITAASIRRYLRWLGEPSEPPTLAPARGPPFFKIRVIRRRLGEPVQAELFDAPWARSTRPGSVRRREFVRSRRAQGGMPRKRASRRARSRRRPLGRGSETDVGLSRQGVHRTYAPGRR